MNQNGIHASGDLYSVLNLTRDATQDDIQRAYKALSTTFHPDKLPRSTSPEQQEEIQEVFLEIKRATDILIDPVLRLTYDYYGEEGVSLIRRIQAQQRDQQNRREASVDAENEDSDDDDDDDLIEATLYERVEKLLAANSKVQAKQELQRFMEQSDYHKQLTEDNNQVHLSCDMDFPPVIDLKKMFYQGREYLGSYQNRLVRSPALAGDREYIKQKLQEEQRLVDYQINRIRDSQKASVGFTLSCTPSTNTSAMTGGNRVQPKWSMVMGATTGLVYPDVAKVVTLAGKKEQEQKHPASTFINMVYQPIPNSQIFITSNLSNDQSHQFILGSVRSFANRSSVRYNMTLLSKSPLETNLIMNVKSFRHVKDIGMLSGGVSVGANGQALQWNAKWEATQGASHAHKVSANVSVGMLQGNSLELTYKHRFQRYSWLEEHISVPKQFEISTEVGRFPKVSAAVTHELSSLASHPTLGFGVEHDLTIGCWTWVWEFVYNNSQFRIPIPVLHLGNIADPGDYYTRRIYYGLYCLLVQSMIADILRDDDQDQIKKPEDEQTAEIEKKITDKSHKKTEEDANKQLQLMENVSERKRIFESQKNGLVILKATYWVEQPEPQSGLRQINSMDATKQLQFWVSNSELAIPPIPKSSWLGFYNLEKEIQSSTASKWDWRIWRRWSRRSVHPEPKAIQPQLTIRYSYSEYVYEITVGDTEAVTLPCQKSSLLGYAGMVQ